MSKIEVNEIDKASGSTVTIGGTGTNVVLGTSGQTVSIASGATTSGMGRTGTVDWQTTPKTSTFTAVSGEGYFCNTESGSFEVDLPAGSAGAIVSIQDYKNTFDTNNLTIDPNGSEKINGGDAGIALTLSTEGQGLTLVYVDSTIGWKSIHSDDFSTVPQTPAYITATGGNTITTSPCGNYKSHIFTAPGTFTVCSVGNQSGSNSVDYLVVAGGGGTPGLHYANTPAGGGGAGGFRASAANFGAGCVPAKPLVCGVSAVVVSATGYPVVVGAGGSGGSSGPGNAGSAGSTSSALSISSAGGGRGGHPPNNAGNGGSGGGATGPGMDAGSGNTPPVSPPQGNNGGVGVSHPTNPSPGTDNTGTGGGGGAIQAGFNGGTGTPNGGGGDGGDGAGFSANTWGATGEVVSCVQYFAGGGAGGVYTPNPSPNPGGIGGLGGGGNGGSPANPSSITSPAREGQAGTANTGGGGASSGGAPSPTSNFSGMAGGSGIVVIKYKFQN